MWIGERLHEWHRYSAVYVFVRVILVSLCLTLREERRLRVLMID